MIGGKTPVLAGVSYRYLWGSRHAVIGPLQEDLRGSMALRHDLLNGDLLVMIL